MCNFYMMYWVDGDQLLSDDVCTSAGPPTYYFRNDRVCHVIYLFNIFSSLNLFRI